MKYLHNQNDTNLLIDHLNYVASDVTYMLIDMIKSERNLFFSKYETKTTEQYLEFNQHLVDMIKEEVMFYLTHDEEGRFFNTCINTDTIYWELVEWRIRLLA